MVINLTHQWPVDFYFQQMDGEFNMTGISYDNSSNLIWSGELNTTDDCYTENCTTSLELPFNKNFSFYLVNWDRWDARNVSIELDVFLQR